MPQFLTTSGTSHLIEEVIIKAKYDLVLITPYLKLSRILSERLSEANHRGVRIRLVYGKVELRSSEKRQLDALTNLEMLYLENLHAKCYLNENVLVISSMNLYEFSEKNNREMGIVLTRQADGECFADALAEAHSIMAAAQVVSVRKPLQAPLITVAVEHHTVTTSSTPSVDKENAEKAPHENLPYDAVRMTQRLFEMLKEKTGMGTMFSIKTEPHPYTKDKSIATITAANYPRSGIRFTFQWDVRFDFASSTEYEKVKNIQRDKFGEVVKAEGNYRIYWNRNVVQIYAASSYEPVDEQATAEYFRNVIVSAASVLEEQPHSVCSPR